MGGQWGDRRGKGADKKTGKWGRGERMKGRKR